MGVCQCKPEQGLAEDLEPEKDPVDPIVPLHAVEMGKQSITVAIVSGRCLCSPDFPPATGLSDCRVDLQIAGDDHAVHKTKVVSNTWEPVWKEEVDLPAFEPHQALEFTVCAPNPLGTAVLEGATFTNGGFNGELRFPKVGQDDHAFLYVKVRIEGFDYPPPRAVDFQMVLMKEPESSWGLQLDSQDGEMLFVAEVDKDGAVWAHNETAQEDEQLRPGDFIIGANNEKGKSSDLLGQFKTENKLILQVRRSEEFSFVVEKLGRKSKLGFQFSNELKAKCLIVTKVQAEWKPLLLDEARAKALRKGDRLVAIGSKRGSASHLSELLIARKGRFQLTFARLAELDRPSSP